MIFIYLPLVLIVLYYALYYYFTRNNNYWKKVNVIGPVPVAFFGNLKETTLRQKNMSVAMHEFYDMYPNEKFVGIYRMTTPCLLIRDLDIIKHIMIKDFDRFKDRGVEFSKSGLGQNLFHADGDTWSALRTRFTPIYTSGNLKNMFPLINSRANLLLEHLDKACKTQSEFQIHSLVQKYTISTIFTCAFGIDVNYFDCELDETLKTVDKLTLTPNYAMELDMMYQGALKKLNLSLFPAKIKQFFYSLTSNIITQRNGKPTNRGDFMDLILQLRQIRELSGSKNRQGSEQKVLEITEDIIAAQAFIFYIGGYETSATTLALLFHSLAMNPEVQEKLIEEIDEVKEAHGGEVTYDSLKDMKYLDKTFRETLRMYPIIDPLQRKAVVDYKVPGTDLVIKKDQVVIIPVRGIQHDKKYYPNPEIFDPSRFDAEVESARHSCAYLPFGIGPRNCIGMRFGQLQSRLCVAKLLSKFRVEPCESTERDITLDPNRLINLPKYGIYLKIVPRDYSL